MNRLKTLNHINWILLKSQVISTVIVTLLRLSTRRVWVPSKMATVSASAILGLVIGVHFGYRCLESYLVEEMSEAIIAAQTKGHI